jgi:hypothetical protein
MMRCLLAVLTLWLATACATAPSPGSQIADADACYRHPLTFASTEGRALHVCPFGGGTASSEFAVVERGVVRELMDEKAARNWVTSLRCAPRGLDANLEPEDACAALVADLFLYWRAAERANARANAAEMSLVRTRVRSRAWRGSEPFLGAVSDW